MKANPIPVLSLFERKMRLEVPLFQRQYVWSQDQQWEPLWEDIARKFSENLDGRDDAPVHFLGAMVLDQKLTPMTYVERRQVIDGQQRLTTFQIFLAAFRDFAREQGVTSIADEITDFVLNRGKMAEPDVEQFKVWPTQLDRPQFRDVVSAGSRQALEAKHPRLRRKYARSPDPLPRMVEAYLFFHDQLQSFILGTGEGEPWPDKSVEQRLELSFQALKNSLQVVVIDLEPGDDAQVIFETLNARGEALLPADLLRNYIFLRAARTGGSQEDLYEKYWKPFDDEFWRVEVKQGRLSRPRSDLFMQHFLASRQSIDIPIKHLFAEYKSWIERSKPFGSIEAELSTLSRQREDFRRIVSPASGDNMYALSTFLDAFDVRTIYPLLLTILDAKVTPQEWSEISRTLESYILRRAVCGLTTKNYNRTFLSLTRSLREGAVTAANLTKLLLAQSGESVVWPDDTAFQKAWRTKPVYQIMNNPKVVHILTRLNRTYLTPKMESLKIENPSTIEHILPQNWVETWPLPDGSTGLTADQLTEVVEGDPRRLPSEVRHEVLQTFGNLTLLTQALNSAGSNSEWIVKRELMKDHSLLPINQKLLTLDTWDETTIATRADEMFSRAIQLWPRP
jgi:uncharacterized protein with ParB-like and HNH nuclease domain